MKALPYESPTDAAERRLLAADVAEYRRAQSALWRVAVLALALAVVAVCGVIILAGAVAG